MNISQTECWVSKLLFFQSTIQIATIAGTIFESEFIVVCRIGLITAIMSLIASSAVADPKWRLGASIASIHISPNVEFNEFNPGINVSLTFRDKLAFQYGFQVGGYLNSVSERTLYGLAFANFRVLSLDNLEFRLGGFAGFFEYPNLIEEVKAVRWVSIDETVLLLGSTLIMRMENGVDFTVGYIPFQGKSMKGVITFQTSIPIGRSQR